MSPYHTNLSIEQQDRLMELCGHFPRETRDALEAILSEGSTTTTIPTELLNRIAKQFSRFLGKAFEEPDTIQTTEALRKRFADAHRALAAVIDPLAIQGKIDQTQVVVLNQIFFEITNRFHVGITMGALSQEPDVADTRDEELKPRARADAGDRWKSQRMGGKQITWLRSENAVLHESIMKTNWPSTIEQPADETLLRIANEYTAHMRAILEARTPPTFQTFFKQLQEFERAMPDSLMRGANALTEDQTLAVVTMCQRFRIVQIENHLKASIDLSRHTR